MFKLQNVFWALLLITAIPLFTGCSGDSSQAKGDLPTRVDALIREDRYEEAIELIKDEGDGHEKEDLLLEKTYLNYALFLEYRAEDQDMRERMTGALELFIKVLEVNPGNEKALGEIKQIMGVYKTLPNRQPPQEILDKLDKMGISY